MITLYEKAESKEEIVDGKTEIVSSMKEVTEAEAEYIHECGHDTNPPTPCRRILVKK